MIDAVPFFFALGAVAALLKSGLRLPAAVFETLSIYLLLAIGLKGGVEIARAENVALWRDAALGHERAFHFFDETSIQAAREAWKSLKDRDGVERHYWKQDEDGRWKDLT